LNLTIDIITSIKKKPEKTFGHNAEAAKPLFKPPADSHKLLIAGMAPIRGWINCMAIHGKTQAQKGPQEKKIGYLSRVAEPMAPHGVGSARLFRDIFACRRASPSLLRRAFFS
jgi:hypothetical protein